MANYSPFGFDATNAQSDVLNATDTITVAGGVIDTPIGQSGTAKDATVDDLVAATATVSALTDNRVTFAGTSGLLEDSANLTFDGSTLAITGALTASTTGDFGTTVTVGALNDMVIAAGSITSVSGAISFGNENLSTTGDFSAADGAFSGDLTVTGDIISRGAVDLVVEDNFIDLNFGNAATAPLSGGLTVTMNRTAGFTSSRVTTTVAGSAGVSNPTFTVADIVGSSLLAANDIVAISGMAEAGNDGLFQVTAVNQASFPQIVTIAGIGTAGVNDSLPFCQSQFEAETGGTSGQAYKIDLAVMCMADGTTAFRDAGGLNYAKGTFVTAYGTAAVLSTFTDPGDYKTAASTLQSAYDGGASWATAGAADWQGTLTAGNFRLIGGGDFLCGNGGDANVGAFSVGTGTATIAATGAVAIDGTAISIDGTAASNISTTNANLSIQTLTSGVLDVTSVGVLDVDAGGILSINSSAAAINLGNDAVAAAINIGTGGDRAIGIGSGVGSVNIDSGAVNIGTETTAATTITLGAATQANTIVLDAGTSTVGINGQGDIGIGTDNDAGNIAIGNAGARTIAIGSGTASAITADAVAMSLDSTDSSNLTMTANAASAKTLQIRGINSNAGGSGSIVMDATTDITVDAQLGTLKLQQGKMLAHTGGVAIGRVLVMQSATAVAEGASTTLTSFQPYGIAVATTAQGLAVPAVTFPGSIVQMDCATTAAVGDVLYLTVGGEVTNAIPAAGNTIMRMGTAMAAGTGLILAMYNPQFIAVRNA